MRAIQAGFAIQNTEDTDNTIIFRETSKQSKHHENGLKIANRTLTSSLVRIKK